MSDINVEIFTTRTRRTNSSPSLPSESLATEPAVQPSVPSVSTFIGLSDTPSTYSGQANKITAVNSGETGLQFISVGDITNGFVPYTGANQNVNLGTNTITANSFITNSGTSSQFVKGDGSLDSNTYALASALGNYQLLSEKGTANGYASLDSNGKVPLTQINDALLGNVNFQGLWNANTNTPTLVNPPSSATKGHYYIVSTAGTFASIDFEVGDWIISNGSTWNKVDNTDAVSSVFGRTGNVTAQGADYNGFYVRHDVNNQALDATARGNALTNLGATTIGANLLTLANPSAVTFPRFNANNTVSSLNASDFRTAIGAGTSNLILGDTSTTAYRGDRGTVAYDYSQVGHLPLAGGTMTGDIAFSGIPTTTNQNRGIYWTGFDKEGTADFSDIAYIRHTVNSGGLTGSVLEISSQNDENDGVNFVVNSTASGVRINGHAIWNAGNFDPATKANTNQTMHIGTTAVAINRASANLALTGITSIDGTASAWTTARTLTIGNTGKSVNGTANVSWSLAEIGAQAVLTNPITGTGTTNFLPKFTGGTTLGNSQIFDNGSFVGINTSNPQSLLHLYNASVNTTLRIQSDLDQSGLRLIAGNSGTNRASRIDFLNGNSSTTVPRWTIINDYFQNGTNDLSIVNSDPSNRVLVINQSGNLGLGVTPSAWNPDRKVIEFGYGAIAAGITANFTNLYNNTYQDTSGTNRYINNGFANIYTQSNNGNHAWLTAPSGTANQPITFTQAMTLTAGGNLGIGTTNPNRALTIVGGFQEQIALVSTTSLCGISFNANNVTFSPYIGATGNDIVTYTNGSERLRITSGGNVGIGDNNPAYKLTVASSSQSYGINLSGGGVDIFSSGNFAPHYQTTYDWYTGNFGSGTLRMRLNSNHNLLINTTSELTGGGRLQVNGNVNCDSPTADRHAVNLQYLQNNTINAVGQSLKNISNGNMQTTTNTYESIFENGSNVTAKLFRQFDITKRTTWDTVVVSIYFRNTTFNSNKLGILRFSMDEFANQDFLEITSSSTNPYSGKFEIIIQYTGANTYTIFGLVQPSQGTPSSLNPNFIRTISMSTNWRLRLDFFSGVVGSSAYGGQTNIYYTVDYKKSDSSILII